MLPASNAQVARFGLFFQANYSENQKTGVVPCFSACASLAHPALAMRWAMPARWHSRYPDIASLRFSSRCAGHFGSPAADANRVTAARKLFFILS